MRVFMVLFVMACVPFAASMGQEPWSGHGKGHGYGHGHGRGHAWGRHGERGRGHDDAHCAARLERHPDRDINKCEAPADDPPAEDPQDPPQDPPDLPPTSGGTSTIDGTVFQSSDPWPGLAGWTVELSGAVNTTTTTDGSGNYMFSGLPAGTYTVCEHVEAGWVQTSPTSGSSCPTGVGYTFSLSEGISGSFVNFGNLQQQ